ncbi:MAG: hypothetical protein ACI31F_05210, partial [Muribaculaceae bacterium]
MKKICLTVLMSMFLLTSCKNENEEKMLEKIDRIESYVVRNSLAEPGYKIYPTQNMWNFLRVTIQLSGGRNEAGVLFS